MKQFLLIMALVLLVALPANSATVTVAWDPNDPTPGGYRVFARPIDGVYDYTSPVWSGPETQTVIEYDDPPLPAIPPAAGLDGAWDKLASTVTLSWSQADGTIDKTIAMVVRAFEGPLESADSNEVTHTTTKTNKPLKWEIFYSMVKGGPYTRFSEVAAEDGPALTEPFTIVPPGEAETVYFVVVSFSGDGGFSDNSPEIGILVDRTLPAPPQNMRKIAVIPVE